MNLIPPIFKSTYVGVHVKSYKIYRMSTFSVQEYGKKWRTRDDRFKREWTLWQRFAAIFIAVLPVAYRNEVQRSIDAYKSTTHRARWYVYG